MRESYRVLRGVHAKLYRLNHAIGLIAERPIVKLRYRVRTDSQTANRNRAIAHYRHRDVYALRFRRSTADTEEEYLVAIKRRRAQSVDRKGGKIGVNLRVEHEICAPNAVLLRN